MKKLIQAFHPTNRRVRLAVGLLLIGLFTVQCTQTEAFRESTGVVSIGGMDFGKNSNETLSKMDRWAKADHIALLKYCLENYQGNYHDYTCTFTKQEVIKGSIKPEQETSVKFLGKPFSVSMTWEKNPPLADKILYVEGKFDNQMLVRPTAAWARAIVPTALRSPDGEEAMRNSLRPVSMFGFERGLKSLLDIYELARKNHDLKEAFGGYAKVDGRKALVLIRHLPDKPEYASAACKTVIFIDTDYLVPIRIEGYDSDEKPNSLYKYSNIKFNVGLTEADFTPDANGLKLPK